MPAQITLHSTVSVTLDELVSELPRSDAAKEVQQLRASIKEQAQLLEIYAAERDEAERLRDFYKKNFANCKARIEKIRDSLQELETDNHYWSKRPCETCEEVSKSLGQDFGCVSKRKAKNE